MNKLKYSVFIAFKSWVSSKKCLQELHGDLINKSFLLYSWRCKKVIKGKKEKKILNLLEQTLHYEQHAIFSWELIYETEACSLCSECSNENAQVVGQMAHMNDQSVSEI